MILAGSVALESMGLETFGLGGGREDLWEPEEGGSWGSGDRRLGDERTTGDRDLEDPRAAVQTGLNHVSPLGLDGTPAPIAAARDIRETFARIATDDDEAVALIAGGHPLGKTHDSAAAKHVGAEPVAALKPRVLAAGRPPRSSRPRPGRRRPASAAPAGAAAPAGPGAGPPLRLGGAGPRPGARPRAPAPAPARPRGSPRG